MGFSSKEIVLRAIQGQKSDRVPVALLSGGVWTLNRRGITLEKALKNGSRQMAEIIEETNEIAKSDIVWPGSGYHNLAIKSIGGKIKFRERGAPDVQEALLKELSDIDKINLDSLRSDEEIGVLKEAAGILSKNIGETTLVGTSQWGPLTLAGHLYGVERLMRSIYKDKEAARTILDFASELCFKYLEHFLDTGIGIVSIADPTASGDLISREQFRKYSLPYFKKVIKKLKAKGVLVLTHICGNITKHLDLLPENGADVLSFDYKVNISDAVSKIGKRMAIAGNINPVAVMQNGTPQQVAEISRYNIEKAGCDSGYILMPGCDIPPDVPLENIKAMVDTAYIYKK